MIGLGLAVAIFFASAEAVPSSARAVVNYDCKLHTYQDTKVSISIFDKTLLNPPWPTQQSPNTTHGNVVLDSDNDTVLKGRAGLISFDETGAAAKLAEIKIIRPGGVSIIVLLMTLSRNSSSEDLSLKLMQVGYHGERIPRGSGSCRLVKHVAERG